jgi:predicted amidohydrolase
MSNTIRVAAAQFHVGNDVAKNLDTCLRMITEAGSLEPDLLVLPEFCNHCSWYDSAEHCYEVSVDLDGPFLEAIAEAARDIGAFVCINCTVRRYDNRVTGTSLLFAPNGSLTGTTNKQVLIGHENDFLDPATEAGDVVETSLGRVAMYSCMDGVINETPRCLALRGAQILCNSLNSFAIDEGSLHIPVRAAENKVWVVAANKVGPLIPGELVEPVSAAINIPASSLDGAGDSQIVSPDGTVVALAGKGEQIIHADIDVSMADDKSRPDGTDIFDTRRPEIYQPLGDNPALQQLDPIAGPVDVTAAVIDSADPDTIVSSLASLSQAKLVCLPALTESADTERVAAAIGDGQYVAMAAARQLDSGNAMCALLVGPDGIIIEQPLLHRSKRYDWSTTADEIQAVDTPCGRIAVINGDDAIFPETFRLLAFDRVSTVMIPADSLEDWESDTGIVERAAENRINVLFASPGASLVASLQKDFTIMTEWAEREFDGLLSCPEVHRAGSGATLVVDIHPLAAGNKECSRNTHLVASRPWELLAPMLTTA